VASKALVSRAPLSRKLLWQSKDLLRLGLPYQARHFHRFRQKEFQIQIKDVGLMTLRSQSSDAAVVSQVFSFRQYDTRVFPQHARIQQAYRDIVARGRRPLILDLGANNGAAARWFAQQYPDADIVSVEPDAENARLCRLNTAESNVTVIEAAIGSSPGTVWIDTSSSNSVSFTTSRSPGGGIEVVTIPQILADRQLDHELFLVKIDIEGFEEDLFSANTEWVSQAYLLMIEPHDRKFPAGTTSRPLQKLMGTLGYQILISGENLIYIHPAEHSA
jgi:FkbM family methyltransferase